MLEFAGVLLQRYGANLGDEQCRAASRAHAALMSVKNICTSYHAALSAHDAQRLVDSVKVSLKMMRECGILDRPKMHQVVHLAQSAFEKGAPALHGTWCDESLNRSLKAVGSKAHRMNWAERVLDDMEANLDRWTRKRRT